MQRLTLIAKLFKVLSNNVLNKLRMNENWKIPKERTLNECFESWRPKENLF